MKSIPTRNAGTWHRLEPWGCVAMVTPAGDLLAAPVNTDGTWDESEAVDVSTPDSQEFLDACNQVFGTSYIYSHFSFR